MNEKELSSIIPVLKNITIQHRGYSVYLKNKNSLGSIVHGNFGAIAPNKINNSAAIIRSEKYVYTPMYFFRKKNIYHLVFNNPTKKNLIIEIVGVNLLNNKNFIQI